MPLSRSAAPCPTARWFASPAWVSRTLLGVGKQDNWSALTKESPASGQSAGSKPRACVPPSAGRSTLAIWARFLIRSERNGSPAASSRRPLRMPNCRPDACPARCLSAFRRRRSAGRAGSPLRSRSAAATRSTMAILSAPATRGATTTFTRCTCSQERRRGLQKILARKAAPVLVNTACATGATAIRLAAEAIRRGEADLALVVAPTRPSYPDTIIPSSTPGRTFRKERFAARRRTAVLARPGRLRHRRRCGGTRPGELRSRQDTRPAASGIRHRPRRKRGPVSSDPIEPRWRCHHRRHAIGRRRCRARAG